MVAAWDRKEGEQETKGRERRKVPLIPSLRTILRATHVLRSGRRGTDHVFGDTPTSPSEPPMLGKRADKA